jgi:hypothetical protein
MFRVCHSFLSVSSNRSVFCSSSTRLRFQNSFWLIHRSTNPTLLRVTVNASSLDGRPDQKEIAACLFNRGASGIADDGMTTFPAGGW